MHGLNAMTCLFGNRLNDAVAFMLNEYMGLFYLYVKFHNAITL